MAAATRPPATTSASCTQWLTSTSRRPAATPGDDLLSKLANLEGDDRLTDLELRATALLLLGAGFETTVNLIGNAVRVLDQHPDQLRQLQADPSGWGNAVEEVLRFDSPVQVTIRQAYHDTEVDGIHVPAGAADPDLPRRRQPRPSRLHRPADLRRDPAERQPAPRLLPGHPLLPRRRPGPDGRRRSGSARSTNGGPTYGVSGSLVRRDTRVLRGYEHIRGQLTPRARGTRQRSPLGWGRLRLPVARRAGRRRDRRPRSWPGRSCRSTINAAVASSLTSATLDTRPAVPIENSADARPSSSSAPTGASTPDSHADSTRRCGATRSRSRSWTVSGPSAISSEENSGLSGRKRPCAATCARVAPSRRGHRSRRRWRRTPSSRRRAGMMRRPAPAPRRRRYRARARPAAAAARRPVGPRGPAATGRPTARTLERPTGQRRKQRPRRGVQPGGRRPA